jgi:pectate lyase
MIQRFSLVALGGLLVALLAVAQTPQAPAAILLQAHSGGQTEPPVEAPENLVAFVGAEGFGAGATGGRGGTICKVSNLNNSGAGSLRACIETTGARMVTFSASGVIDCSGDTYLLNYARRDITILGQTSPLGVTLKDCPITNADVSEANLWPNVFQNGIFQFLTMHSSGSVDTFGFNYCHNIILDHVTARGTDDEILDFSRCRDITVGWTICSNSNPAGQQNCLLAAYEPTDEITLHHLLSAHHNQRTWGQWHWATGPGTAPTIPIRIELINNLAYNASFQQVLRMDVDGYDISFDEAQINLIGNTVIEGPSSAAAQIMFHTGGNPLLYNSDNVPTDDGVVIGGFATVNPVGTRHAFDYPVTATSAAQAYEDVLTLSGSLPRDECVDVLVAGIRAETGDDGLCSEVLNTATGTAWPDVDSDGCSDTWETANGLSTASSSDCAAIDEATGYANVELWGHDRRAELRAAADGGSGGGDAPSWADALSVNAWTALSSTNTFNDVRTTDSGANYWGTTGSTSVYVAWSGGALLDRGTYGQFVQWGGGHTDYYGNEVYLFDLETLTYARVNEPYVQSGGFAGPFTNGILSNGTPNVPHTYYHIAARGDEMWTFSRQLTNAPSNVVRASKFDLDTETWTNSATAFSSVVPSATDEGFCYDSSRDGFWGVRNNNMGWGFYDAVADTYASYAFASGHYDPRTGCVYVPGKDAVVIVNTGGAIGMDPASPSSNRVVLTTSGSAPTITQGSMMHWSENLGAIVYYKSRDDLIYLLTPPSGTWSSGTWVWSQRSLSGTSGTHSGSAGTYGKFILAEWGDVTVGLVFGNTSAAPRAVRLQ